MAISWTSTGKFFSTLSVLTCNCLLHRFNEKTNKIVTLSSKLRLRENNSELPVKRKLRATTHIHVSRDAALSRYGIPNLRQTNSVLSFYCI